VSPTSDCGIGGRGWRRGSIHSIITNLQLNPSDGAEAMAGGNPTEAFLNCLFEDEEKKEGVVRKEKDGEGGSTMKRLRRMEEEKMKRMVARMGMPRWMEKS